MEELYKKYPQFEFIEPVYSFGKKTYIRAEYKDEALASTVGDYYYCFEDGNFLLVEDLNDLISGE
jgi:hypothetical protein